MSPAPVPSNVDVAVFLVVCGIVFLILTFKKCFPDYYYNIPRPRGHQQDIESGPQPHATRRQPQIPPAPPSRRKPKQPEIPVLAVGTVVVYKNGETRLNCAADVVDEGCIICLEEFEDGDYCRVLSKCQHIYHMICIDRWLVKDTHCPLCRGSVQFWNQSQRSRV